MWATILTEIQICLFFYPVLVILSLISHFCRMGRNRREEKKYGRSCV